jgi:hypothetical protein
MISGRAAVESGPGQIGPDSRMTASDRSIGLDLSLFQVEVRSRFALHPPRRSGVEIGWPWPLNAR